ncbi:MAG TPA: MFS transporter [Candidatus Limnocylindria bacterium]|jgi:sugar phosphate permease|nr:MFS transporter [Candidatus Limnocylindria bacterium]
MTVKAGVVVRAARATKTRYVVLAILCLLYFISYLDRVTISVTAPKIIEEFHFSKTIMGSIFSAFAITYTIFQIPGGTLGDRFGPRSILAGLMAFWSAFTILAGLATSYAGFFVNRLFFGAAEAGGFPVATRALATYFPPTMRGFLQGVTHAASRSGAAFAPPIVVAIVGYTGGWRPPFYILGALGFLWTIGFYLYYRNNPAESKFVNQLELDAIGTRTAAATTGEKRAVPWKKIFSNKDVWMLTLSYFAYGYTLWIYLTWLPTYLKEGRHFSFAQMGFLASIPLIGAILGDLFGGWASDAIWRRTGNLNFARRSVIVTSFIGAAAFTIPAVFVANPYLSVALQTGAMFMLECAVSNCWAVAMDLGGRHYCGTTSAIMNMASGVSAIVSPFVFGVLVDRTGSWAAGFVIGSVILVLGAVTILFTDATNSVDEPLPVTA